MHEHTPPSPDRPASDPAPAQQSATTRRSNRITATPIRKSAKTPPSGEAT